MPGEPKDEGNPFQSRQSDDTKTGFIQASAVKFKDLSRKSKSLSNSFQGSRTKLIKNTDSSSEVLD